MEQTDRMKLLLYDTKYYYNSYCYDELKSKGADITRLFDIDEIEQQDLAKFNGLIAHSGIENQRDLFEILKRHPDLKVAIISSERGAYDIKQGNIAIFDADSANEIYQYFSQKPKAQ